MAEGGSKRVRARGQGGAGLGDLGILETHSPWPSPAKHLILDTPPPLPVLSLGVGPDIFAVSLNPTVGSAPQRSGVATLCNH